MKVVTSDIVYCSKCRTCLMYDKDDISIEALGMAFITCPECGKKVRVYHEDVVLTKENLRFPNHYFKCSAKEKPLDERIDLFVRAMISHHQENPDVIYSYADDDNTFIITMRDIEDSEYKVFVATNGYYETAVPFEENENA